MSNKLRLLSWNVHLNTFAIDNKYVVNVIKQNKPDIICLQEYVQGADITTKDWLESNNYKLIYLPFAKYPDNQNLSQGLLVAANKSIDANYELITLRKDKSRKFRNFNNIRGVINCKIMNSDGVEVNIINAHSTFARPYTIDMRKREFAKLIEYLDSLSEDVPMVMCGDFNFLPFDSRKRYLKEKYNYFTGNITEPTWKHSLKYSPIRSNLDYIFWNNNSLKVTSKLLPFRVSDHRPIITEINI